MMQVLPKASELFPGASNHRDQPGKAPVKPMPSVMLAHSVKRWKEVQLVMFTVYIDDSGSDPNQPVANATALIVPGRRILALQREWDALKAVPRVSP